MLSNLVCLVATIDFDVALNFKTIPRGWQLWGNVELFLSLKCCTFWVKRPRIEVKNCISNIILNGNISDKVLPITSCINLDCFKREWIHSVHGKKGPHGRRLDHWAKRCNVCAVFENVQRKLRSDGKSRSSRSFAIWAADIPNNWSWVQICSD